MRLPAVQLDPTSPVFASPQAIYGTILVTSVIAGASFYELGPGRILAAAVGTMVVFYLAHVYAEAVAGAVAGKGSEFAGTLEAARREKFMLTALVLPGVVLAAGALGALPPEGSIVAAQWAGVLQLAALGLVFGIRRGLGPWRTVRSMIVFSVFGVAVVVLKMLVH